MNSSVHIRHHHPAQRSGAAAVDAADGRRGRVNAALALAALALIAVYALSASMLAASTWQLRDAQLRLGDARAAHDAVVADIATLDDRDALTALATGLGMGEIAASYIVEGVPVAAR